MSLSEPFYVEKLRSEFKKRKVKNGQYSLRSFARLLDIDSSILSAVLKKKRPFPIRRVDWAIQKLSFTEEDSQKFYQSVIQERFSISTHTVMDQQDILTEDLHFNILSQWEYYAVLTLFDVKSFRPEPRYLAKKLGLTLQRAEQVWLGLEKAGLIFKAGEGVWKKRSARFVTTEDVTSLALRLGHLEELELAKRKLHRVSVLEKDYSSTMVALPKKNLIKAKRLIRQFRKDFADLVEESSAENVYLLALQLFPLTVD
jgi:uncharacterized protein (TIGR02147 family)